MANINPTDLCRACLTPDGIRHSLNEVTLCDLFTRFTSITINNTDCQMPRTICDACRERLLICEDFALLCQRSDLELTKLVRERLAEIKVEDGTTAEQDGDGDGEEEPKLEAKSETDSDDGGDAFGGFDNEENTPIINLIPPPALPPRPEDLKRGVAVLKCGECGKTFYKQHAYEGHLREHLGFMPFQCRECDKEFRKFDHLTKHQERAHSGDKSGERKVNFSPKEFHCSWPGCVKAYASGAALDKHQRSHNGGLKLETPAGADKESYMCEQCGFLSATIIRLRAHKETHIPDDQKRLHPCRVCGKSFRSRTSLHTHSLIHNGPLFTCYHCDARVLGKLKLKRHMEMHSARSHHCPHCPKTFNRKGGLWRHVKFVHLGIKRNKCMYCGQLFTTSTVLQHHVWSVHTKERPFQCGHCDASFVQKANLRSHVDFAHLGIVKHRCAYCNKAFELKRVLEHHQNTHTGTKPHVCTVCGRGFVQKVALVKHLQTHRK